MITIRPFSSLVFELFVKHVGGAVLPPEGIKELEDAGWVDRQADHLNAWGKEYLLRVTTWPWEELEVPSPATWRPFFPVARLINTYLREPDDYLFDDEDRSLEILGLLEFAEPDEDEQGPPPLTISGLTERGTSLASYCLRKFPRETVRLVSRPRR